VVWSAVRTATLKNAVRMIINLMQGRETVTRGSPSRVNNMRISNVSTFVWNRGIRANIARMLAAIVSNGSIVTVYVSEK
jgi:predicted nuclease of predicted toxin-antitoxin system